MPTGDTFAPFIGNIPVSATATLVAASTAEVSGLQTLWELLVRNYFQPTGPGRQLAFHFVKQNLLQTGGCSFKLELSSVPSKKSFPSVQTGFQLPVGSEEDLHTLTETNSSFVQSHYFVRLPTNVAYGLFSKWMQSVGSHYITPTHTQTYTHNMAECSAKFILGHRWAADTRSSVVWIGSKPNSLDVWYVWWNSVEEAEFVLIPEHPQHQQRQWESPNGCTGYQSAVMYYWPALRAAPLHLHLPPPPCVWTLYRSSDGGLPAPFQQPDTVRPYTDLQLGNYTARSSSLGPATLMEC